MRSKVRSLVLSASLIGLSPGLALAEATPWQTGLQEPATSVMERVTSFHDMMMWIITLIVLFVLALLVYACWRFSEARNPVPSRRSHNTMLEVAWTAVPVLILVIVAIPSFKLLYYMDVVPKADMTIKAIGRQWYWSYEYPDHGNFTFDAYMIADSDLQAGQRRLLETDNRIVVPVDTNVRIQTTAGDVLHSWAMPQFGIKIDAIPGRLNEMWFNVKEPGTYYGQCSELCGVNHGFMPITVDVVTKEAFDAWVQEAQSKFARVGEPDVNLAAAAQAAQPAN